MKYFRFIIILLALFLMSHSVQAAEFYFSSVSQANDGQFLIVKVMVKANDPINAVEGSIVFNNQNLSFDSADESNSVVPLWIDHPKITDNQTINFSGIIPGGLSLSSDGGGTLFFLKFKVNKAGTNTFDFTNAKAILNQAGALEDQVTLDSLTVNTQTVTQGGPSLVLDFYPPEEFQIFLYRDPSEFNGEYVIAFNTQDKGSGINHYEVRERFLGFWGAWKRGDSPYQLSHQSLFSIIEVKAIDNIGRERLENYIPISFIILLIILGVIIVLSLVFTGMIFSKRYKFLRYVKK